MTLWHLAFMQPKNAGYLSHVPACFHRPRFLKIQPLSSGARDLGRPQVLKTSTLPACLCEPPLLTASRSVKLLSRCRSRRFAGDEAAERPGVPRASRTARLIVGEARLTTDDVMQTIRAWPKMFHSISLTRTEDKL